MGAEMVWRDFSSDRVKDVQSWVIDVVLYFRNRGHRNDEAIRQAALALGMTPRRTRAFFYDELFPVSDEEWGRVRVAMVRHLNEQADDLAARSAAARARRRQMELGI